MIRLFILALTVFGFSFSFAATTSTSIEQESVLEIDDFDEMEFEELNGPDYDVEGSLTINTNTQTTDSSPLLGASFLFHPGTHVRLGLRFLLPTSSESGEGASTVEMPIRYVFKPNQNTLFLETSLGMNRYSYANRAIGGLSIGVLYKLAETLSIGGSGGVFMESGLGSTYYPRITTFINAGI